MCLLCAGWALGKGDLKESAKDYTVSKIDGVASQSRYLLGFETVRVEASLVLRDMISVPTHSDLVARNLPITLRSVGIHRSKERKNIEGFAKEGVHVLFTIPIPPISIPGRNGNVHHVARP